MNSKKFVIYLAGPSCVGKSTIFKALAEKFPGIYLVSYDKQKWQLAGYHRDHHGDLVREITMGVFEVICKQSLNIELDFPFKDERQYAACRETAEKYGYVFVSVQLTAPDSVLIERFRERLKNVARTGGKVSIDNEELFLQKLSTRYYTPQDTPVFDTSSMNPEEITNKIVDQLSV